jgi:hypothetical protein
MSDMGTITHGSFFLENVFVGKRINKGCEGETIIIGKRVLRLKYGDDKGY